jgi:hypothetical protein
MTTSSSLPTVLSYPLSVPLSMPVLLLIARAASSVGADVDRCVDSGLETDRENPEVCGNVVSRRRPSLAARTTPTVKSRCGRPTGEGPEVTVGSGQYSRRRVRHER